MNEKLDDFEGLISPITGIEGGTMDPVALFSLSHVRGCRGRFNWPR